MDLSESHHESPLSRSHPWEIARERPPHVDFVTDDLAAFLAALRPAAQEL